MEEFVGAAEVTANGEESLALATLRSIWVEALECEIGDETLSFFDNGGDSLGAIIVLSRVKQDFDVEISLEDFFDNPTLEEQAAVINQRRQDTK